MGCKKSKNVNELYNKDVEVKRRIMTGIHISKGADGVEGNVQVAFGFSKHKKYDRVPTIPEADEEEQHAIEE